MAHSEDRGSSGDQRQAVEHSSLGAPPQLNRSTAQLITMLEFRLDLLRKSGDPQLSEIARQLEGQLAEIRSEIGEPDQADTGKDDG